MILSRNNAIIGGLLIVVAAGFAVSWAFGSNGGSSSAGSANWGNEPLTTLLVGIFGTIFTFTQAYILYALKQLSKQMSEMEARLTNQIGQMGRGID